jgi:hypothetical protein
MRLCAEQLFFVIAGLDLVISLSERVADTRVFARV